MLNHAARYFPILHVLRQHLPVDGSLVEVGSGSVGIGEFWPRPFVGCDISFPVPAKAPMRAVVCSADDLPFPDRSFDAVVASDVMEHIPPDKRARVVEEIFRVARGVAIFGFPCGSAAWTLDQRLHQHYRTKQLAPPGWLEEHMQYPFPDENLFLEVPQGWTKTVICNESLKFHGWMMRAELHRAWRYAFRLTLRLLPGSWRWLLRHFNDEPCYRKIFVFTRES